MKNLKIISMALVMLSVASCEKSDEDLNTKKPNQQEQNKHSFGGIPIDETTYNSFEKADITALTLKVKGKDALSKVLPKSYFVPGQPAIGNQGQEGSCSAWATAYAATSILETNFKGVNEVRSPEYVYNQIKAGECTAGALLTDALNLIKNQGVCSWNEMPYNDTGCSTQPNTTQKNAASSHKIVSWATVNNTNITDVKNLLTSNLPVIIGIQVFQNLYDNTGTVVNTRSGNNLGYHFVCIVGYDDTKNAFKIQNSWGTFWGDNGYLWLDYTLFKKSYYSSGIVREAYVAYIN